MFDTIRLIPKPTRLGKGISTMGWSLDAIEYVEARVISWEAANNYIFPLAGDYISIVKVSWKSGWNSNTEKEICVDLLLFEEEERDTLLDIFF